MKHSGHVENDLDVICQQKKQSFIHSVIHSSINAFECRLMKIRKGIRLT